MNRVVHRVIANGRELSYRSNLLVSRQAVATKRPLARAGNFYGRIVNIHYETFAMLDASFSRASATTTARVSLPGKCFVTARGVVDWETRTRGPKRHVRTISRTHARTYATLARRLASVERAMIHGAFVSGEASLYERPQVY